MLTQTASTWAWRHLCTARCIHSLRIAIMMKCVCVAIIALCMTFGKCFAHFVWCIGHWSFPLTHRFRWCDCIFFVARNAAIRLSKRCVHKFNDTSLIIRFRNIFNIIAIHCDILLLFAHFVKIFENSYDWQLYCAYRHILSFLYSPICITLVYAQHVSAKCFSPSRKLVSRNNYKILLICEINAKKN